MYLILLQFVKPVSRLKVHIEKHKAFLDKYYKSGHFVYLGNKTPFTGTLIICKAKNRKEVENIMMEDPLAADHVAFYEIIEFEPAKHFDALSKFF